MNHPEIFVLSGPNGAGKSTTATVLLPESLRVDQFVNADLIARGLSPFSPESSPFDAGRVMLARVRQLRDRQASFALETTLAGRSYVRFLREAQEFGYSVHVIYIWLRSVQLALSRVAVRVQQGGHGVSDEIVERRYWLGLRNFFNLYRPLADTWTLCDNSAEELITVARGSKDAEATLLEPEKYDSIRKIALDGP